MQKRASSDKRHGELGLDIVKHTTRKAFQVDSTLKNVETRT
jgi:hypothetical protein